EDGERIHTETGAPLTLNILLYQRGFERLVAPMIANLKKLGIPAKITMVEVAQWQRRVDNKDFDIMLAYHSYFSNYYPGNEQRSFWHSSAADVVGSRNYIQLKHPAVDAMVDAIDASENIDELIAAARALDRILLWEFISIPQYHIPGSRLVYWNKFEQPDLAPLYPLEDEVPGLRTWWVKDEYRKPKESN
ncbi:MAG: hypothetical protein ACPG80_00360, partial [Rickettsiales bacterium]